MNTISLCMIVKNEEDVLARCLDCVRDLADEIIIVDTGSKDATCEIARQYTAKVYDFAWVDDFAAARNFSFSKAEMDYVMWLDADDILLEADLRRLLELKEALNPSIHTVMMKYNVGFDADGNVTLSYYRERLFLRSMGAQWAGAVHEAITPQGNVIYSDICITHKKLHPSDPDRNLRIFERQILSGKPLAPRERFYYGRELMYHGRFTEAVQELTNFLDSGEGWVENCINACQDLAKCHTQLEQREEALTALLRSLRYDSPRAELCCDIGNFFLEKKRPEVAAFWYETALSREPNEASGGFVNRECYEYLPCIQLCVCYDRMGNREKAVAYNEQAGKYKPGDASVEYNRRYFAGTEHS